MSSNVRNRLKFAKIARKDLLCTKMQKIGYLEFDRSGTLMNPLNSKETKCLIFGSFDL